MRRSIILLLFLSLLLLSSCNLWASSVNRTDSDVQPCVSALGGVEDTIVSIFTSPHNISLEDLGPFLREADWELVRRLNDGNDFDLLEYLAGAPDAEDHLDVYLQLAPAFDGAYATIYGAKITDIYNKDRRSFVRELAKHANVRGLICGYIGGEYADHPDWGAAKIEAEGLLNKESFSKTEREIIKEIISELEKLGPS